MATQADVDPDAVLRHYAPDGIAVAARIDSGFVNDNWLVAGRNGEPRYVLRAYRRLADARRIEFQLAFQDHLLKRGLPTCASVRTRSGAAYAIAGGLYWALFEFVAGDVYDFNNHAQARAVGTWLARFEEFAESYDGPVAEPTLGVAGYREWVPPVSSHVWRASVLSEEHEERLRELFPNAAFAPDLEFFARWRRDAAEAWPPDRLTALPEAWLHCDYHGRNMVFQGDMLVGLFDFDFVTRGPRAFDVGRGVFNFGREHRGSRVLREAFCRAFLDGFESVSSLSPEERQALPVMAVLKWVPDASFYAAWYLDRDGWGMGERLHRDVESMRAIEAEMRRLAPQFGWAAT